MVTNHEERKKIIEEGLKNLLTTKEIGRLIGGVSKQRVYQLMTRYGLSTPERKRQGYWKNQNEEYKWLHRTVTSKDIPKALKHEIFEELENKLPSHCPVLGIELVYGNEKLRQENSASIDRLDSSKPYSKNNIHIISWRANRVKNNGTLEEHKKIVAWMEKHQVLD